MATRYGGGRQPSMSSALGCLSAPPPLLMPPLDLDMSVYSRHFTDQSSVMGCGDLIQSVLAPPQQIAGGAEHHAASSYMGSMAPVPEQDRQLVLDLAATAADTLAKMCRAGEPLWVRCRGASSEVMVADEHAQMFSWPVDGGKQGGGSAAAARTEGSRDSAVVIMNSITLVDAFLDAVSFQSILIRKLWLRFRKILSATNIFFAVSIHEILFFAFMS
jgi:hypothetical protein